MSGVQISHAHGTRDLHADAVIAAIAGAQHGRVTRRQLLAAGVGAGALDRRVGSGHLIVLERGLYAVGHAGRSRRADLSAAALRYGALGFGTAAELLGIEDRSRGPIHVVVPIERSPGRRRGIVVHRTRVLLPHDVGIVDGIATTLAPRTLADLATVRDRWRMHLAVNRAEQRGLLDVDGVRAACRGGVAGQDVLLDILDDRHPVDTTTGALFLGVLEAHGLPLPELEVPYRQWRLDAFFREQQVAIELDDYATHSRRDRFERDRELAASLARDRIAHVAFTYRQLTRQAPMVARTVAVLIGVQLSHRLGT